MTSDVDDFLRRVEQVAAQVHGLRDGVLPVTAVDEAISREERRKQATAEAERAEAHRRKLEEARKERAKQRVAEIIARHEARMQRRKARQAAREARAAAAQAADASAGDARATVGPALQGRPFATDYSRWDDFTDSEDSEEELIRAAQADPAPSPEQQAFMASMERDAEERAAARAVRRREGDVHKDRGNASFKAGRFEEAVEHYTAALAVLKFNTVYLTNRALAYLRLGRVAEAEQDATTAVDVDEKCIKGYVHRASARAARGALGDAISDLEVALGVAGSLGTKMERDRVSAEVERQLAGLRRQHAEAEQASADSAAAKRSVSDLLREGRVSLATVTIVRDALAASSDWSRRRTALETLHVALTPSAATKVTEEAANDAARALRTSGVLTTIITEGESLLELASGGDSAATRAMLLALARAARNEANAADICQSPSFVRKALAAAARGVQAGGADGAAVCVAAADLFESCAAYDTCVVALGRTWPAVAGPGADAVASATCGIACLGALLSTVPVEAVGGAARAVSGLARVLHQCWRVESVRARVRAAGVLQAVVQHMASPGDAGSVCVQLVHALACDGASRGFLRAYDAVPALLRAARTPPSTPLCAANALGALANAALDSMVHAIVCAQDVASVCEPLLAHTSGELRERAAALMARVAQTCDSVQQSLTREGMLDVLAAMLSDDGSAAGHAVQLLAAACRQSASACAHVIRGGTLDRVLRSMSAQRSDVYLANACLLVGDCCARDGDRTIAAVCSPEAGHVRKLYDVMHDRSGSAQRNAAIALARLARDDGVRQALRDLHGIELMFGIVQGMKK